MVRRTVALGLLAAVALGLAGSVGATAEPKKQRDIIAQLERIGWGTWSLQPATQGPVTSDRGRYTWMKTLERRNARNGQSYRRVVSTVTFEGANGTLVVREDDVIVSAAVGKEVVTGTWTILRGTDAYEGVRGGGRLAAALGFGRPDPWRYEGFMTSP